MNTVQRERKARESINYTGGGREISSPKDYSLNARIKPKEREELVGVMLVEGIKGPNQAGVFS